MLVVTSRTKGGVIHGRRASAGPRQVSSKDHPIEVCRNEEDDAGDVDRGGRRHQRTFCLGHSVRLVW